MVLSYVLVALGGALGAITRFITNNIISIEIPDKPYLSTLVVNVIGSILLGFFYFVSTQLDLKPNLKDFFVIGYLGSLTTFSALSFEFANMINQKDFIKAFNYLSLNIALGFISVYLFIRLAREV